MRTDYSISPANRSGRPRKPIEIAMTPMIDVIFLLLVFFLATSSFQLVEYLMPSGVSEQAEPKGNSEQPPTEPTDDAIDQIIVKLQQRDGKTIAILNDVVLPELRALETRLKNIASTKADVPVIIDPEGDVLAAAVIQAYDWARASGLSRVYLATKGA
ncbi:MAG: biopolymer transporter ExbD [Planctomycetota bacterium]